MPLIAVDWGTSSLRAALLDDAGKVLEERSAPRGILTVEPGQFATVLVAITAGWTGGSATFCLISGMAGSKQGWIEAPYCACPAGPDDLAQACLRVEFDGCESTAIVPGLSDEHEGVPDVMRGEEVQIFGAMALSGLPDGLFVLPGTHSKWALVEHGRISGFDTFMTGEVYALLSRHSILARTLEADAPLDENAFLQGVQRAANNRGLLHNAFGTRTLALFDRLTPAQATSYLSGLLIGEELHTSGHSLTGRAVVLIGAPELTRRYASALKAAGATVRCFGAEATWAGLHALHLAARSRPTLSENRP